MQLECPHEICDIIIEEFYMSLLCQNDNRIKKSEMSIRLNLCLVNCTNSLFVWIIYVYCNGFISECFPEARRTTVSISYSLGVIRVV
jgi:hypothetical protein